ncbi:MAG: hypothetical protein ACLVHC_08145, partial [Eggerthella lenta]
FTILSFSFTFFHFARAIFDIAGRKGEARRQACSPEKHGIMPESVFFGRTCKRPRHSRGRWKRFAYT